MSENNRKQTVHSMFGVLQNTLAVLRAYILVACVPS